MVFFSFKLKAPKLTNQHLVWDFDPTIVSTKLFLLDFVQAMGNTKIYCVIGLLS